MEDDRNTELYIAIEKYMQLLMIEFKDHLNIYKNMYANVFYYLLIDV
jgi:hypothetical protein